MSSSICFLFGLSFTAPNCLKQLLTNFRWSFHKSPSVHIKPIQLIKFKDHHSSFVLKRVEFDTFCALDETKKPTQKGLVNSTYTVYSTPNNRFS